MTIYVAGALTLLLPALLVIWHFFGTAHSKTEWLLRVFSVGSIVLILCSIGTWSMTSYYLRHVVAASFVVSTIYSFLKIRTESWSVSRGQWGRTALLTVLALLGLSSGGWTLSGAFYPVTHTTNLEFPFDNGRYYVIQGGSNWITNPFHGSAASGRYAIDIVQLGKLGNRAARLVPTTLEQYHIFGEVVLSPCQGRVISARGDLPDNLPPTTDPAHSAGNHVVIECNGARVLLAHFRENSLRVSEGDEVRQGQPVGEAGNSGYSDEPHLHIQANTLNGDPVAMSFRERFLSTNDLFVAE